MPRWPSQPAAEPAAKRARKNAVKDTATAVPVPDVHHAISEALSGAEAVPSSVRDMLCAGLGGCLASVGAKGGKAITRHPFQDRILAAVVDALEVAETTASNEVAEAEVELKASQAEMASCEEARQALELGLVDSSLNIEGREKGLEDGAEVLEKTRHELGVAEGALRRIDTEIGEAAMRSHQISQVLRLVTSLSEKGAPDGEAAKFLNENRQLIDPYAEHVAAALQATEQPAVEEPVSEELAGKESVPEQSNADQIDAEQSVSEQQLVNEPPARDQSSAEQSRDEQPASEQLAEQLSHFSKCITELEGVVSRGAEARILRVAEVDSVEAACSTMLSNRLEESAELREVKQVHRHSEISLKSNAKELKQITAKCDECVESCDSARERLTQLQQGPLSTCKCAVATTTKAPADNSNDVVPAKEMKGLHAEQNGNVEMRVELIQAGC